MGNQGTHSIWDGLPAEWEDAAPERVSGKPNSVPEPEQGEHERATPLPTVEVSAPPDMHSVTTGERVGHKQKGTLSKAKSRSIDKQKYQEFEKRSRENRYNSSEKAKIAYQNERKENRKDFMLLGISGAVVIVGIVVFVLLFSRTSNQKIYDLIDAQNYSTAYRDIEERYENGKNVDALVYAFVENCVSHDEYKRAVASLDMLSSDANNNAEFFRKTVEELQLHNKANRATEVLNFMYQRGGTLSELAEELSRAYQN